MHEDAAVRAAIEGHAQRLEALLASRVPDLKEGGEGDAVDEGAEGNDSRVSCRLLRPPQDWSLQINLVNPGSCIFPVYERLDRPLLWLVQCLDNDSSDHQVGR